VGFSVAFLLSSLAMVQLRCRLFEGFPCGDWSQHSYTWHFWPPFLLLLLLWLVAAERWSRQRRRPFADGVQVHRDAAAPMLGLVLVWAWYGLTGSTFHPPACTAPLRCHDTVPAGVLIWSLTWLAWGRWRLTSVWGDGKGEAVVRVDKREEDAQNGA